MKRIRCTECATDVRTISKPTSKNSSVIRQACCCNEASHDAHPYEVDGWEWVEGSLAPERSQGRKHSTT